MNTDASDARPWIEAARGRVDSIVALRGGAGRRRYWRATHADGGTSVFMHAVSENPKILPPALRADVGGPVHASPFVQITRLLDQHGIPVPRIYALDDANDWILLEDLGDRHLLDLSAAARHERSLELIDLLARVHAIAHSGALPFRRRFDADWVGFELRLFLELVDDSGLHAELGAGFARLAEAIAGLPGVLCLRDVQSQNVLIDASDALRLIDYQDALLAPRELDLCSLLHDSYVDVTAGAVDALLDRYAQATRTAPDPGAFSMLTVQRKCKDFSRFHSLVRAKGDLRYGAAKERAQHAIRAACRALPQCVAPLAKLVPRALDRIGSRS